MFSRFLLILGFIFISPLNLKADFVYYSDESTFLSQGTILNRLNLDSYANQYTGTSAINGILFPGPYGLYVYGYYPTIRPVAINVYWSTIEFGVDSSTTKYNMLSFDLGNVLGHGIAEIDVTTNLNSYTQHVLSPYAGSSLSFEGFVTTNPGEYITGFVISSYGVGPLGPGATDFQLGLATTAPEPSSLLLFVTGLMLLSTGFAYRRLWLIVARYRVA